MATSRTLYEASLIELNKENAPNITLEDFNYFANKAINQYINKRYNIYDINQQTTDDLRVLKATTILQPKQVSDVYDMLTNAGANRNATYECILPADYLHMLNCICIYNVNKTYKCYNKGNKFRAAATRLTADAYSTVLDNYWNRPTYNRPYYYIHNVNSSTDIPTNPYHKGGSGTDAYNEDNVVSSFITESYNYFNTPTAWDHISQGTYVYNGNVDYNDSDGNPHTFSVWKNGENIILTTEEEKSSHVFWGSGNTSIIDSNSLLINNWKNSYYIESSIQFKFLTKGRTDNDSSHSIKVEYSKNTFTHDDDGSSDIHNIWTSGSYTIDTEEKRNPTVGNKYNGTDGNRIFQFEITDVKYLNSEKDAWGNSILNNDEIDLFRIAQDGSSNIERAAAVRYGNASQVRLEIRYGTDNSVFALEKVYIDYIKTPQNIRLTQEQLDKTEDTSQVLEFPDYVCQEIINELVTIIMENISDPKLLTHPVVSLSIANPAQQLTQPQQL